MNCSPKARIAATEKIRMVIVLFFLTALVNCGGDKDQVFKDVLQSDCDPPCWRGVTPGVTTRGQVVKLLGREPEESDRSFPRMSWGTARVKGGSVPEVEILLDSAGKVLSTTLAETKHPYTFEDAVKEWGNPSRVMSNLCSPETDVGYIYLVYPEKGVAFATGYVPVLGKPWQQPSARNRIYRWIYFAPTSADKMLLTDGIIPGCGLRYYGESSEWSGFGK